VPTDGVTSYIQWYFFGLSFEIRQVRQLIKQAIEMPTSDGIANFLNFSTTFGREVGSATPK
jgi:hypothetical protein